MDLFTSLLTDVEVTRDQKPPIQRFAPYGQEDAKKTIDQGQIYKEFVKNYVKTKIPSSRNYIALLSVPVIIMFITISWRDHAILLKFIVTILSVIHVIIVSNTVKESVVI